MNSNKKKINDQLEIFNFSDSETDSDNITNLIDLNKINSDDMIYHINILDNLELKYYPEPYNTIGQLIMSVIIGASTVYILNLRLQKIHSYHKYLDSYFDYCTNIKTDDYINNLITTLRINILDDIDTQKLIIILSKINIITKQIMDELVKLKTDIFLEYTLKSEEEFKIESFNVKIIADLIKLIKFSKLINLTSNI
jgi:hypothetical protein